MPALQDRTPPLPLPTRGRGVRVSGAAGKQTRSGGWFASTGAGIALCLGNPSTVLIYMLLLPSVAPTGIGSAQQLLIVLLVTFAAVGAVFFGAILLARQFNRVIASSNSSSLMNRATAAVIASTAVWMLAA